MAHGSKKFIRDFKGKLKRSRHRTKEDYYGELRWWEPMEERWCRGPVGEFCPQCKSGFKGLEQWNREYDDLIKPIEEDWYKTYPQASDSYSVYLYKEDKVVDYHDFLINHPKYPGPRWYHDYEAFLCPKHKNWSKKKDEMWRSHFPGEKKHYGWTVKEERRAHRQEIRQKLRNGDYDIPKKFKRNWLD